MIFIDDVCWCWHLIIVLFTDGRLPDDDNIVGPAMVIDGYSVMIFPMMTWRCVLFSDDDIDLPFPSHIIIIPVLMIHWWLLWRLFHWWPTGDDILDDRWWWLIFHYDVRHDDMPILVGIDVKWYSWKVILGGIDIVMPERMMIFDIVIHSVMINGSNGTSDEIY